MRVTDHQLAVADFVLTIVLGVVVPLLTWLYRKLKLLDKKQIQRELEQIIKLGERPYAEKQAQKMRFLFGFGGYWLSLCFIIPHTLTFLVNAIVPVAAALCFLMAGSYGQASTLYGVRRRVKSYRKLLGLTEKSP